VFEDIRNAVEQNEDQTRETDELGRFYWQSKLVTNKRLEDQ